MTVYRFLANVLLVPHLALIGLARGWHWVRNFWFRVVHFLMIAVVVAESLVGVF